MKKSHPEEWLNMINENYLARTCHSSLKLSDLVSCLDATDRVTMRTVVVARFDIAAAEGEEVGVVAARS